MTPLRLILALAASAVAPMGAMDVVEGEPTGEVSAADRVAETRTHLASWAPLLGGTGPGPASHALRVGRRSPAGPPSVSRPIGLRTPHATPAGWLIPSGPTMGRIDLPPPRA